MTEEMRARTEAEKPHQLYDIMLAIVEGPKRYPLHVQIRQQMNWDDLIQAWHALAAADNIDGFELFPTIATADEFKDEKGNLILKLEDSARIFAYPIVSTPSTTAHLPPLGRLVKVNIIYMHFPRNR
jgi:hypothetical protein